MKALYLMEFKKYLLMLVYPQSTEQQVWGDARSIFAGSAFHEGLC